jgi:hypothetical protein
MRKLYLLLTASLFFPTVIIANTTNGVHKDHKKHNSHKIHKIHTAHKLYKEQLSVATVPVVQSNNSSDFKVTGYVDGSYNYQSRNKFTSGSYDRVYDQVPNGLTLQQTAITLAYQPSQGFGGLLNLMTGRDVNGIAPYGFKPVSEFDSQTIAVDFTQAYLQYVIGPVTIIGGRFTTSVGVEQVDPTQNANFSRSILFYNTPDTHTGLRVTYAVNGKLNLILGVNDGWDNIRDWSRRKTIEFGMSYILNPMFSFSVQGYNGEERATSQTSFGPTGIRTLIDLIATLNATEKLTFIANYDYGWQTKAALPTGSLAKATWSGIAGYANYKFNDKWRTSLRGEVFDDQDGFRTGARQNWREVTLTFGYMPLKNLEIRAEARHDFSNVNSFVSSTGISVSNNNQSYALEGIYKFG